MMDYRMSDDALEKIAVMLGAIVATSSVMVFLFRMMLRLPFWPGGAPLIILFLAGIIWIVRGFRSSRRAE